MSEEARDLPTAAGEVVGIGLAYVRRIPRLLDASRAVTALALPKRLRAGPVGFFERAAAGWQKLTDTAAAVAKENDE